MKPSAFKTSRRKFCALSVGTIAAGILGSSCQGFDDSLLVNSGRLIVRPHTSNKSASIGRTKLGLDSDSDRDAILQLPARQSNSPLPLMIMLHGAGQNADDMFYYLGSSPDEAGVALLVPHSREATWDAIGGSFGPDVLFLNHALERVFEIAEIDSTRLTIAGFSDGASYALSLGLINGDLFPRVVAFSAGFVVEGIPHGKPSIFISHGTSDRILPIDACGRRIVADLKNRGYDITFREFTGGHEIPESVSKEALSWTVGKNNN